MAKFKLEDGTEIEAFTGEEVDARITQETAGLKLKVDELLDQVKPAQRRAQELEEKQAEAERKRMEENQEFQALYQKEQEKARTEAEARTKLEAQIRTGAIESEASRLAATLTRDTKRAALLAEKLASAAEYTENGVAFSLGGVAVDTEAVLQYAQEEYPFLVDGKGSTGGGANGGSGGAAQKGDIGGNPSERRAAIKSKYPDLPD